MIHTTSLFLFSLLLSTSIFAVVESGFLKQGKKHVVFRDGVKVGKSFAELYPGEAKMRKVASETEKEKVIHYVKDDNRHCYYLKSRGDVSELSCVK